MGFDMPARQAFTVEMTSREDLLNAISLNSSIVNGARVIGPSVAGLMIGAVGRGDVLFPERPQLYRRDRGFDDDASAVFRTENRDRFSGGARVGGILYSIKTSACAHDFAAILAVGVFGWSYAVLMPAFARDVLGRGANGYGILMSASGAGAFVGCLAGGDVWTSFHAAQNRTRRCLVIFPRDAGAFVHQEFSGCARISLRRRI